LNDLIITSAPLLKAEEVFFQSFANSELASGIDTLDMSHQGLKDMHIKHLANSMTNGKFCPKRLIFMDNTISDTGVSYLLEALHHCPRLQRLDLSFNDQITSDGVSAINKYFFNHSNSKLIVWIDYQQMLRPSANGHTNTVEMQNILNNSSHFNILRGP
jgi:Ran GTPase-activating protein (RanGAP) involved in mRNA processing and transport